MVDVIIIGQGPAGISCAIYLKRYNLNPLVIAKDYGALEVNSVIENYYGIKSIDGQELIKEGIEQAKELGIEVVNDEVINIEQTCQLVALGAPDQLTVFRQLDAFGNTGLDDLNIRIRLRDEVHRPDLQTLEFRFLIDCQYDHRN